VGRGIYLYYSSNNVVSGNTVSNNGLTGIYLYGGNDNIIKENIIANNDETGILVWASSDNKIFHNNFVDNTLQARTSGSHVWDDGYPSGGNYWSDYSDVDFYSGPYQNETGSDGIGDTPYVIDGNNQDNYPLIDPSVRGNVFYITWKETEYSVTMLSNSTISGFTFNHSLAQISFNVTGPQGTVGFCRVTIPKQLLDGAFKVQINDAIIGSILTWNGTHTFVYFTYTHSTAEVRIIGEIVTRIPGDIDGDGYVGSADFSILAGNYGKTDDP